MIKNISVKHYKRGVLIFLIIFFTTFLARTWYELVFTNRDIIVRYSHSTDDRLLFMPDSYSVYEKSMMQNVASERLRQQSADGHSVTIDQKYEMTAHIAATSENFSEDNKTLRQIIEQNNAVIQMENMRGLPGNQVLDITIGVVPDNFDTLVSLIREIGELRSFDVNKVDKTNEYHQLTAQMETLQKSVESYNEMKERGGDIKDLLQLEDRILSTQQQIQDLGVNLGVFSTENSFCTVIFSMREVEATLEPDKTWSMRFVFTCIRVAFFWTLGLYFILFSVCIGGMFGVWLLLFAGSMVRRQLVENVEIFKNKKDDEDDDNEAKDENK